MASDVVTQFLSHVMCLMSNQEKPFSFKVIVLADLSDVLVYVVCLTVLT